MTSSLTRYATKSLAAAVAFVLISEPAVAPAGAQTLAESAAQTVPKALNIVVTAGEGASNRVRQKAGLDPTIRVEDESQKPLSGAAVVFTLPTEGATGEFVNGSKTLMVMTDGQGAAAARGLRLNQVPGKVQIHVNVSYRGLTARTNITQFTEAPPGYKFRPPEPSHGHGKLIAILAVIAGAGAAGAVLATRKSSSSSGGGGSGVTPTPIGITAGTGAISPPR